MFDVLLACCITLAVAASAYFGSYLHRRLSESHRSQQTMDFVRTITGLLTTFTALIMGLLLNEVNTSFSKAEQDIRLFSTSLISLNTELNTLGKMTDEPRALLQEYVASTIADTWPGEERPPGPYIKAEAIAGGEKLDARNFESLLLQARDRLRSLPATSEPIRAVKEDCLRRLTDILDQRWRLISEAHASISTPLLMMMVLWLIVVFASFGVTAPRHRFSAVWIAIVAFSVGGAVYTILELDGPLDGMIRVSSQPLRRALLHLRGESQTNLPPFH